MKKLLFFPFLLLVLIPNLVVSQEIFKKGRIEFTDITVSTSHIEAFFVVSKEKYHVWIEDVYGEEDLEHNSGARFSRYSHFFESLEEEWVYPMKYACGNDGNMFIIMKTYGGTVMFKGIEVHHEKPIPFVAPHEPIPLRPSQEP